MIPKEFLTHNMLTAPGKFEGEAPYVRWLWDHMEMESDNFLDPMDEIEYSAFFLDESDCEALELAAGAVVVLWESDQGFVYSNIMDSQAAWNAWIDTEETEYALQADEFGEDDDL